MIKKLSHLLKNKKKFYLEKKENFFLNLFSYLGQNLYRKKILGSLRQNDCSRLKCLHKISCDLQISFYFNLVLFWFKYCYLLDPVL